MPAPSRVARRGVVHIWVVLLMVALIGFVGIALDAGYTVLTLNQMQAGADAAALAGALQARVDAELARSQAVAFAAANSAAREPITVDPNPDNLSSGDVVLGRYNRDTNVFTPNAGAPNACKVVVRRTAGSADGRVNLFFGPVFGINGLDLTRTAIAMTDGSAAAGMVILDLDDRAALGVGGSVTLTVLGGTIHINSNHSSGAVFTGDAAVEAEEINIVGGVAFNGTTTYTGYVNTGEPVLPDPLAWLPAPTYTPSGSSARRTVAAGTTETLNPGYYGGELVVHGTANLNPGIYIFDNGISVQANGTMNANGVMLYIANGSLNFSSGAHLTLSPPDADVHSFPGVSTYEGIAIFQSRTNTRTARFELSEFMDFSGTFYFPKNQVDVHSDGDNYLARLIANTMNFSGVGAVTIDYRGRDPAAGNRPFLVE
jgi:Flp pilus assembly protein TadG